MKCIMECKRQKYLINIKKGNWNGGVETEILE